MTRLSNEEIDEIAIKYLELRNQADESPDNIKTFKEYQNLASKKLSFLVDRRVAKYRQFSNFPDLEQDGFEALMMAFKTFEPNKGVFSWWADQYIKTRVSRAANSHSTIKIPMKKTKFMKPYKVSELPIITDDCGVVSFCDMESNMHGENISDAIEALPDNHKSVIKLTYGLNGTKEKSIAAVMKILSISRQQYNKLLIEAKIRIKKYLLEN